MDYRYKQLEQELSALTKVFAELGARLSEGAKDVTSAGVAPSEKLIDQIAAARTSFDTVRNTVHGHAGTMLVSPLPKLGELLSVATIDALIKAAAVAEENKFSIESERAKALSILTRVLSITHREIGDFKPLQDCHARIGELRNAIAKVIWPQRHPESESITGLKHPATALLSFVENLETLEDERWMALETTITEYYGKPVFVAASRGKLAVQAEASKPVVTPVAASPAPAVVEKPVEKPVEKSAEKPVEKKIEAEKAPAAVVEKKVAAPPPPPPAVSIPAVPAVEKKEAVHDKAPQKPAATVAPAPPAAPVPAQAAEKSQNGSGTTTTAPVAPAPAAPQVPASVTPAPVAPAAAMNTPAVVASVSPASQPLTSAPAPAGAAPVASVQAPPHAPEPVAVSAQPVPTIVSNPVPAAPAPAAQTHTGGSLTALATATEPAVEKKSSPTTPADHIDKQRKEPRLAAVPVQQMTKPELKPQEQEVAVDDQSQAMAGDGSQRPQRWGFWRGNR